MASSKNHKLRVFFFPFLATGHILPMANLARLFSDRGISSTIITTPANSTLIHLPSSINLLLLPFPPNSETNLLVHCENTASLPNSNPNSSHISNLFKAIELLRKPLTDLLQQHQPDFLISDWVYSWTADLAQSLDIPRLTFQTCSAFCNVICDQIHEHKPHLPINGSMPFQVHGIGHRIEMVKGELPVVFYHPFVFAMYRDAEMKSYGTIMNSFYELEPLYVDFLRGTRKLWCVTCIGPVGYGDNQQVEKITKWLDSKDPDSVIYVCFGSECTFSAYQINEMARGLEASGHPFIWVLRIDDIVLPSGFEARMEMGERKGLVVRGWAPQAMILNHPSVGGFMTHCGWNSILEGVSAGLPMAAWPLQSEQFINEKMVVEVLEIGVKVLRAVGDVVDEEIVKKSVELLMGGGQQSLEMRMRAKEYQAKARAAMENGGASSEDLSHLIGEMEDYANKRKIGGG